MAEFMTTRQLARYLQLSERSVYRLLERGEVPAVKVGGQWRFRRSAVDQWLDVRLGRVGAEALARLGREEGGRTQLSSLIEPANVMLDLPAGAKPDVLAAMVERLVLPEPVDRSVLLTRLLEREALCTTALAGGIAVPHTARSGARLLSSHDRVALGRLAEPVDYGALDGSRTDLLFLVLARDERSHLILLAKVARLAGEKTLAGVLRTSDDPAAIIAALRDAEARLFRDAPRRGWHTRR